MLRKREAVSNAFRAHALDRDIDFQDILAARRRTKIARRRNARETHDIAVDFGVNAEAHASQQLMLSRFHKSEEGREMHNPGHVGIGELDKPGCVKRYGHE